MGREDVEPVRSARSSVQILTRIKRGWWAPFGFHGVCVVGCWFG